MTNLNKTFKEGNTYEMRFIGDSELRPHYICTKRTPKTVVMKSLDRTNEVIKRRIKIDLDDNEYVVDGNYSMAPSINSSRIVN